MKQIGITDVILPVRQVAEQMGVSLLCRGMPDVIDMGMGRPGFTSRYQRKLR